MYGSIPDREDQITEINSYLEDSEFIMFDGGLKAQNISSQYEVGRDNVS
jgi:hypothetical protein